jgi:hypothetical protein
MIFFRSKKPVKVKFYFLFLISDKEDKRTPEGKKNYSSISKDARDVINSLFKDQYSFNPKSRSDNRANNGENEEWYFLEGTLKNNKALIKHFKMRIIWEIEEESDGANLAEIFLDARKRRKKYNEELKYFRKAFNGKEFIDQVFDYLLIEVGKDYKPKDFKKLEEEAITTFFYEVPDYRRKGTFLQRICLPPIPKTIIRLSRPSTITSKMSDFMRTEVINILYDACLYHKRQEKKNEIIKEEHFRDMKTYLGKILFDTEMSIADGEIKTSVHILSLLMGIGAIAGILAIIAFLPLSLCEQDTIFYKSLIGFLLLLFASWIFFNIFRKR